MNLIRAEWKRNRLLQLYPLLSLSYSAFIFMTMSPTTKTAPLLRLLRRRRGKRVKRAYVIFLRPIMYQQSGKNHRSFDDEKGIILASNHSELPPTSSKRHEGHKNDGDRIKHLPPKRKIMRENGSTVYGAVVHFSTKYSLGLYEAWYFIEDCLPQQQISRRSLSLLSAHHNFF